MTKIYFRYLFARLFMPFAVCLAASTLIWIMVDVYGNLEDFLEHKGSVGTVLWTMLRFYSQLVPSMLVQVLPAALLFSTLWTLLALNRRSELVAFQAGGMAPFWLFLPFLAFGAIWVVVLALDLNWPSPLSLVTRDRLLQQVKGQSAKYNVFSNLPYIDRLNRRIWFFQELDVNRNTAKNLSILQRDDNGNDIQQYFAQRGEYTPGGFWRLTGVLVIVYNSTGGVQDQINYQQMDTDITTPPKQISLGVSPPDYLTVSQLSQYIATSTSAQENLAKFRTEWWYRFLDPLGLLVLMLFGLLQGARLDRRSAAAGVFKTIIIFLVYFVVMSLVLQMGNHAKLPPFIAAIATQVVFGLVGLSLLATKFGWWWQLLDLARQWKAKWRENRSAEGPERGDLNG
jgi:lipopolysaccharide export system permease protein